MNFLVLPGYIFLHGSCIGNRRSEQKCEINMLASIRVAIDSFSDFSWKGDHIVKIAFSLQSCIVKKKFFGLNVSILRDYRIEMRRGAGSSIPLSPFRCKSDTQPYQSLTINDFGTNQTTITRQHPSISVPPAGQGNKTGPGTPIPSQTPGTSGLETQLTQRAKAVSC